MLELSIQDRKWIDNIWEKIDSKLLKTAIKIKDFIPYTTVDGKYVPSPREGISWWTNGFYGGMMWLMYNATKKEEYKKAAEEQEKMLEEAFTKITRLQHDVGFMWGLTAKTDYILTGNEKSRIHVFYAANLLAARVNIKGGFIRAWNTDFRKQYSIIDCMMNLPLLYWASREFEDDRFRYIAELHADMARAEHIREDGSVVHICVHDENEPKVIQTLQGQGYAEGSAWSRGQAWAVYGFILSYIHTKNEDYLEAAKKTADYFLEGAKKYNYKVVTDFNQPETPFYIDNTAAVCGACGMIEIYKETKEKKYLDGALNILKALEEDCVFDDSEQSILQKGMESYKRGNQLHIIYGDFFFVEAILKLKDSPFLIW